MVSGNYPRQLVMRDSNVIIRNMVEEASDLFQAGLQHLEETVIVLNSAVSKIGIPLNQNTKTDGCPVCLLKVASDFTWVLCVS